MDFFDVVKQRRSVRSYLGDPVPREVLDQIVAAGIEAPSGCNMQLRQYVIVDDPAVMARLGPVSAAMKGAPAAVVLLMDPRESEFGSFWVQDASAAMQNMLLAAVALGYGACWVEGALRRREDLLHEILGVPGPLRIWALLPVGRSADTPARPPKSDPAEVVHYNAFGRDA